MAKRKQPVTGASSLPPPGPTGSNSAPVAKRARFSNSNPPKSALAKNNKGKAKGTKKAPSAAAEKPLKVEPTPPAPKRFVVSAGSYERLLYGLECTFLPPSSSAAEPTLVVQPIFSFPAHLSSLRTVASSKQVSPGTGSERKVGGKYLVSGGQDEVIKVWDLRRRKEVGSLEGDTIGTITALRFVPSRNMLLAASTDSTISLYRVRDWVLLRGLKGHKGRVNSVDAHPDGRVALSVGVDRMLRMWDLVAGKSVTALKLGVEGDLVRWNTNGSKFAVICNNALTVYGLDMTIHHQLTSPSRLHDAHFCYFPLDASDPSQREYLFTACEDGNVRIFDVTEPNPAFAVVEGEEEEDEEKEIPNMEPVALLTGHSNRVKMMDLLEVALPHSTVAAPASTIILTSASSDGKINLYDLSKLPSSTSSAASAAAPVEVAPAASFDTDGTRLTCICAVGMAEKVVKGNKGKKAEGAEEEEESDESGSEEESGSEGEDEEEFEGIGEFEGEGESEEEEEEEEEGEEE